MPASRIARTNEGLRRGIHSGAVILAVCAVGACRVEPREGIPSRIAVEDFMRQPTAREFHLSPDGDRFAYVAIGEGREELVVTDITKRHPPQRFGFDDATIDTFLWADDGTLVAEVVAMDEARGGLFRIQLDGSTPQRCIDPTVGETAILDPLAELEGSIAVSISSGGVTLPWRLSLSTWELELAATGPADVETWVFDRSGRCRAAVVEDGPNSVLLYRNGDNEEFAQILRWDNVADLFRPLLFTPDGRRLIAYSNLHRDRVALVEVDPRSGAQSRLLFEDPEYDLFGDDESDHVVSAATGDGVAYAYYTGWRRKEACFTTKWRELFERLHALFPAKVVRPVSADRSGRRHIIRVSSDRLRGRYHLFDEADSTPTLLYDVSPWLDPEELAEKLAITFQVRDGLTVHGYLTLPRGRTIAPLPLVVVPHGGPHWRDCWEIGRFTEVQMFANRGWAVFNVNFRGSTGYGKEFLLAGFKQNGLAVQNDISDGVAYLIDRGIVDRDRVAIVGGSYGGYAVLAGLAFTPDLYVCGVDLFGVSNFFTFFDALPPWVSMEGLYRTIGHPELDRDLLKRTSPALHADNISAPLLIAQGGMDPIVRRAESDQMVEALRGRGVEVRYIFEENEGHGYFRDNDAWIGLWREIDSFLAAHLGTSGTGF